MTAMASKVSFELCRKEYLNSRCLISIMQRISGTVRRMIFPQHFHKISYRNRASKRDSRLSGRKHVIILFSIAHVTFKRGPHLELSIALSQFELIRQGFTVGMNIKILLRMLKHNKKMEAQTQSIVDSHLFPLSFYESFR
jgi:hypothetical protein